MLDTFTLKSGARQKKPKIIASLQQWTRSSRKCTEGEEEIKVIRIRKEDRQLSLFADHMIFPPQKRKKRDLQIIRNAGFIKVVDYSQYIRIICICIYQQQTKIPIITGIST